MAWELISLNMSNNRSITHDDGDEKTLEIVSNGRLDAEIIISANDPETAATPDLVRLHISMDIEDVPELPPSEIVEWLKRIVRETL